ncbi:tetratricopeptide repeat protein [Candidatus Poseidonia alphae]|nr:tetratricopeptide repeat protein [Candidatus Poseidonia alphae]
MARINDMESNLKNILATVNAKQVSRVRTEREAANRKASEGMTYGPTLEEIQAAAQPGHNVAETVLMEVFRTVRQVFAQCRVRSTKIALNRTAAEDDATHQPVVCPYDPTRLTEEGLDVEDDNIPSLGDDGVPLLHMSHLSYLLRNARKREDALSVEAVMWGVWVAHSDWRVSTEMMQGNNLLELGKTADAITFYQNAADLDPTYAEPYNKIAAASLRLEQYRQCEEYAEKGLERCPQHYAAMAGFGTALEKRGILGTACKYLEQTLVLHPFAGRVPTFLATVLNRVEADRLKAMETVLAGIEKSDSNVIHNVTVLDPSDDADVLAKVEEISRNVSEVSDPSAGRHGASAPLQDSKTRYTRTWETTSTPEPVDEKNR